MRVYVPVMCALIAAFPSGPARNINTRTSSANENMLFIEGSKEESRQRFDTPISTAPTSAPPMSRPPDDHDDEGLQGEGLRQRRPRIRDGHHQVRRRRHAGQPIRR